MSEIELKNCPFCGSPAHDPSPHLKKWARCSNFPDCKLSHQPLTLSQVQWNTRVNPELDRLTAENERLVTATRYALATFRALERYTFEDSDHGLLIAEAVNKLEALTAVEGKQQ